MGHAAHAQPVFDIPQGTTSVSLSEELEYFVDETGQWQPDSGEPAPGKWLRLRDRAGKGNFGFLKHPVWFRVVLRSPTMSEWVWVVSTPQLEWVTWVQQRSGKPHERSEAGLGPLQEQRVPLQRLPTAGLMMAANESVLVHMRVQSSGLMQVPVDLWEPSVWQERERRSHALLGAYFGLLGALLAYNGFLALRLRDQAYGYYLGFGLSMGVFQLSSTGFGPSFLWAQHALSTYLFLGIATTVFGIFSMLFTDSFLRMSRVSRRMSLVLRWTAVGWVVVLLTHLWLPAHTVMSWLSLPFGLLTITLIMVAGVTGYKASTPAAGYFLLGWTGIVLAVLLRALLRMGLLPPHPLLYDGMLIASAIEMVLLSLALADRIMTERRARAEADVQRAREQVAREEAQRALQEKSRFMAAVTHDLQQPIYALSLATESMALRRSDVVSTEALNQMQSAVFAADELLSSLAMQVRLDRDDLRPDMEAFSVQDMLERIDALFATRAQKHGLRWRVLPSLCEVRSNPLLLERMVCNLVSNAMRYTPEGGVMLSCRVRSGHLLIQVWDTGPGIPVHEQSTIFEAHYRGSAAQSHDRGLGLGLSIVSRCAALLDVRVGLKSVPGRGSCFALWVPLVTPP
ncbi:MAG: sensor histidine kinase [Hydrogenophaga sp.]|uniref:sensor histidine kinase n=1 Tax=Hydrogenophaga sp. TaxID=1904254 RepID=UPI002ABBEAD7|nr:sensor histidine kinase [Hydrogenophaga sp.]MDZ4283652.1 sensor histidine kinase [Hydrogenophaga sp.]